MQLSLVENIFIGLYFKASNSKRNLLLLYVCIAFDTISFQSMYWAAGRLGFLWFSEVNLLFYVLYRKIEKPAFLQAELSNDALSMIL